MCNDAVKTCGDGTTENPCKCMPEPVEITEPVKLVRAKFKVTSITQFENGKKIELNAVSCGSKENETFFKYTPCANVSLSIVNEEAANQFIVGKEYYVDFSKA